TTPAFTVSGAPTNGTASIDPASGEWTYTPTPDYNGDDSFTVSVTDDDGNTETQVIDVTVTSVADIAPDNATTDEDTAVTNDVLGNDSFESSDAEVTAVTQGTNGSVSIDANGQVTYTPDADFHGSDSYTYTVTSGGVTETATVNVTVDQANDPASFGGDTSGNGAEDTTLTGTLTVSDNADGMSNPGFAIESGNGPANGTASIDPASGEWTYTPNADYNGDDSFTVSVT
ncbi:Ig-like domain-containing protein, partial [Halomonas halmophila]|uniref:Ig-like domain-containing protein n=1 Tax=Halomonas halmophila TaxID=252 RepID=UPI001144361A